MKSMILDLETLEIAGEISYGGTPGAALVDPDGRRMFVPIAETGELVVVDVYKKEIMRRIKGVGTNPTHVALAATNNYCH
jgi:DNA-binding beta-propeller fold protein YncE